MAFALNGLITVAAGLALWAFLPRGVVLTRELQLRDANGERQFHTWRLRNHSPLPVTITAALHAGADTFNAQTGETGERELPPWLPLEKDIGVSLAFEDSQLELERDGDGHPWRGMTLPPGDTLLAYVSLNRTLTIRYRRAGPLGVFERRVLRIDGGV